MFLYYQRLYVVSLLTVGDILFDFFNKKIMYEIEK